MMEQRYLEAIKKRAENLVHATDGEGDAEINGLLVATDLSALIVEVERLQKERDDLIFHLKVSNKLAEEQGEKLEHFEEALEFYADEKTYKTDVSGQWEPVIPIDKDNGEIARKALEVV